MHIAQLPSHSERCFADGSRSSSFRPVLVQPEKARKFSGARAGVNRPSVPQKRQSTDFSRQNNQHLISSGRNQQSAQPDPFKSSASATYSAMLEKHQQQQQQQSIKETSAPTASSSSLSEAHEKESCIKSPCQAVHGLGKGQQGTAADVDKLDVPLSFNFLKVDSPRLVGTCSFETKVDTCFHEEAADSISMVSKELNEEAVGSRSVGSLSCNKNEEVAERFVAAEKFLALLQTPEMKIRHLELGSPGRAHGDGRKEKEACTLFSLLSLPAYHSAILGV